MHVVKILMIICLWISTLLFLIPTEHYYMDLLQSFTFHASLGYLLLGGLFALLRWRTLAASSVSICFLLAIHLFPHINNQSDDYQVYGEAFRVAHFNVLASNTSYHHSIRKAKNTQADLISFQEVNMQWINMLIDHLETDYPYYAFVDGENHGVAVFSRHPIQGVKQFYWTGEPTLTGNLDLQGKKVHFVTTHTLSPRSPERSFIRNQHLEKVTEYVSQLDGPALAIGDFNTVPWSQPIVHLKENTDLQDSRKSLAPTFPADLHLGIPIDYILHSDEISCLSFHAIESEGSDHRGVIGEYAFTHPDRASFRSM